MENDTNYTLKPQDDESLNLREELDKYISHWKWFVFSIIITLSIGGVYIRYAAPEYLVSSTLLIKPEDPSISSELSAFQDLGMLGGAQNNVANEIQILKSRYLAATVIRDLKLDIRYFKKGNIKETEVYDRSIPFELIFTDSVGINNKAYLNFYIDVLTEDTFNYVSVDEEHVETRSFGESFYVDDFRVKLDKKNGEKLKSQLGRTRIKIVPSEMMIGSIVGNVEVEVLPESSVLKLSLKHLIPEKAKDILNTLINNYNKNGVEDKSEVGKRTSVFISQRLEIIENELEIVDRRVESYKKENNLTDVESQSDMFSLKVSENEKALFETTTQLQLVGFMDDYIKKQEGSFELLPANLGFEDPSISVLLGEYNDVVLQRNKIVQGSSMKNPMVKNLEYQLISYQNSLKESLGNVKSSLNIRLNELKRQDRKFNNKIGDIPTIEREYSNIRREQSIKEALYLYLLQKEEENEISLAVTTANSKVIDMAFGSNKPIAPRSNVILLAALFIGLVIPLGVIFFRDLLDNKVHSRKDLESVLSVPLLGDIPLKESNENIVISKGARSSSAEAFRLLRTNLDFMLAGNKNKCKTILLSSTVSGEGKSFISINLACSLALSGKKVALLGMDLRAPKIIEYLDVNNKKGITNYIMDGNLTTHDIKIELPEHKGLDIYASGVIPPNPAELLMHSRVDDLFDKMKQEYDYVIVDTAPVNLVSDTLLIADRADLFIYVTRANYLDKRLLEVPKNLHSEKRLPNMAMLLNGTDYTKGYGYGSYGAYGYGQSTNKSWKEKLFKKKNS